MAGYVDGFVMPLPKSNVDRYREVATTAGGLWIEHGALEYKECLADDGSPTSHASIGTMSTPR